MTSALLCPHGHRLELSADAAVPALCPVCGVAVRTGADMTEAETTPPVAAPAPAAETATVMKVIADGPVPVIPGYEVQGELGRGGMGLVYRARQLHLDRLVAIKVLPVETDKEGRFAERFTREARSLARLNHPNILTVHDFGQTNGQPYFVMEYVDGSNLRQRLRAGPRPASEALRLIGQVCEALQYAHEEGIVHRDVKPENVLLDRKGRVKIADFGIAKLLTRKTGEYTLTGPWQVMGTWHYMAPEQLENPQALDHRADIYAVGVMLYELLTGGLPQGHFPLPSQKVGTDPRLDAIILKALEKEPDRRYQHVGDMKAALDACQHDASATPARAAVQAAPATEHTNILTPMTLAFGTAEAWARRVRGPAVCLLWAGVASLLPTVGYWILRSLSLVERPSPFNHGLLGQDVVVVVLTVVPPLLAGVVIVGSLALYGRRHYALALIGSIVALVPYSTFAWPLCLAAGIGALITLTRPDVRAAYLRSPSWPRGELESAALLPAWLRSTPGWCMVCCLVGLFFCLQPWSPWAAVVVYDSGGFPFATPMASVPGYQSTFALIPAGSLAALFLVLLATGQLGSRSLGRGGAMLLVGLATAGFAFFALYAVAEDQARLVLPVSVSADHKGNNPVGQPVDVRRLTSLLDEPRRVHFEVYPAGLAGNIAWAGPHAWYHMEGGRMESVILPGGTPFSINPFLEHLGISAGAPVYWTLAMGLCLVILGALQIRGIVAAWHSGTR